MSAFAQSLSRLRCAYSMLLRLGDKPLNYPQRTGVLLKRELGTLARPRAHAACRLWQLRGARSCVVPAAHRNIDTECDDGTTTATFPESIRENVYAHSLFLNSQNYENSVMRPTTTHAYVTNEEALRLLEQDWSLMRNDELVSVVKRLSYNIRYSDEAIESLRYKNVFDALYTRCLKLSDENLKTIIRYLVPFRQRLTECSFYYNLYNQLNNECVQRFTQLRINDMLLLCDMLHQLNHRSKSEYIWYAMRKLGNKPNKLTPHQLVQVLFFLNVCRKPPINMYELEYRLEQCLDDLSINEVGIATLGFFKTGTQIRSPNLLRRIMKRTIAEIELGDSVSIGGIIKLIRYSMRLTEISVLKELLDVITAHEPRFTLMTLTHIAHACAKVALYHKELMDRIIKRLNGELKSARLKDLERLIFVFSSFNIESDIYQNVNEELRSTWDTSRALHIAQFPYVVSRTLGYMSYMNIYPTDLIQRVMMPAYVHKICSGNYNHISREYCVLDYSLRLEVPEYEGPFLKPEICSFLAKKYFTECKSAESSQTNILLTAVLKTMQEIFDTTSDITIDRPLPHYVTSDIVFCLDERNQLLPSEEFLSSFAAGEIKRVNKEDARKRWIALVMAPHALVIRTSNLPIGLLAARIRQLSIIGYTPILISQTEWGKYRTQQERCDHIRNVIFKNSAPGVANT